MPSKKWELAVSQLGDTSQLAGICADERGTVCGFVVSKRGRAEVQLGPEAAPGARVTLRHVRDHGRLVGVEFVCRGQVLGAVVDKDDADLPHGPGWDTRYEDDPEFVVPAPRSQS